MNKKLIALAVAGACFAPTVMAQTANPVTLYGRIFVTLESVEADGGATPLGNRTRVSDNASYLGVRGTEDLGGGLKAFFQLETAWSPEGSAATGFATRNSGVGLQGGWGSVLLGRWDTPMKTSQTAVDPWGDLTLGDITGAALDQGNFSRREGNSVQYWSPNWAGLTVRALYTANEGKTATLNPNTVGASVAYSKGALYLAYAYENHKDVAANTDEEGNAIAASFTMGGLKLAGQYGVYSRDGQSDDDESYMLGLTWNFSGKHAILASYQNAEQGDNDCDMYSVGYKYDWSKRTFFVASYTEVDNSAGMNCNFGTNPLGTAGQDMKGFMAGFRHLF